MNCFKREAKPYYIRETIRIDHTRIYKSSTIITRCHIPSHKINCLLRLIPIQIVKVICCHLTKLTAQASKPTWCWHGLLTSAHVGELHSTFQCHQDINQPSWLEHIREEPSANLEICQATTPYVIVLDSSLK